CGQHGHIAQAEGPKVEDDDVSSLQPYIISGIRSDSQCAFEKFQRPICIKGRKGKRNRGECLCAYWRHMAWSGLDLIGVSRTQVASWVYWMVFYLFLVWCSFLESDAMWFTVSRFGPFPYIPSRVGVFYGDLHH
ncbi:hypothetical protein CSA_016970, partial [Cucumis sativus]